MVYSEKNGLHICRIRAGLGPAHSWAWGENIGNGRGTGVGKGGIPISFEEDEEEHGGCYRWACSCS